MGLPRRLAALAAAMAVLLVLGATEIALSWSERSRLEDFRLETVELAHTLADYLTSLTPHGDGGVLARALAGWSRDRIEKAQAWVYLVGPRGKTALVAASDSTAQPAPGDALHSALLTGNTGVEFVSGAHPRWQVSVPLGHPRRYGVLEVEVSTGRLRDWALTERRRAYGLALASALLLALGVAMLTSRWVGRPLDALGRAMAGAHGGAGVAPAAPELGPSEFRTLARRYNRMREALAAGERESLARASLLALEERARGFDRVALLEETAAEFAHEIGTPLNTLSGHLQLLRDDLASQGDPRGVERVDLLLGQVERVAGTVRAGMERGAWPEPRLVSCDLGAIAERMLRFLEPSLAEAGVHARHEPAGRAGAGGIRALCDPGFVEHILLNLIKNAIEALEEGGTVTVTSAREGERAVLEVADDGPGLAAEALAQLFHPYATTKGSAGTGLGLVVCRRLAEAQGGRLDHVPAPRGARWRLSLPAADGAS